MLVHFSGTSVQRFVWPFVVYANLSYNLTSRHIQKLTKNTNKIKLSFEHVY